MTTGIQYLLAMRQRKLQGLVSNNTDDRMKLVSDVVQGVRTIKCYGWEKHYIDRIKEVRNK